MHYFYLNYLISYHFFFLKMFFLTFIFFRVIPPTKINILTNQRHIKAWYEYSHKCNEDPEIGLSKNHLDQNPNKNAFIYCSANNAYVIQKCYFYKIRMYRKIALTEYDAHLLHFNKMDLDVIENRFEECDVRYKVIYCEGKSHSLKLHSNNFTKCTGRNTGNGMEILSSFRKTNSIKFNKILFENRDKSGRAFFVNYNRGLSMIGNVIENANYKEKSSVLLCNEAGEGSAIEISNNTMINCYSKTSDLGVAIIIYELNENATFNFNTLKNNIVEYTYDKKYYKGYSITIETKNFN